MESVPRVAHLIWLGDTFPWLNALAVRSAALRGGFDRVILHHDTDLSRAPHFAVLGDAPRVELRRLDPEAVFGNTGARGADLAKIYARLRAPATRSDLLRLAILYAEGGVYLDVDTVTVGSFRTLCDGIGAFCGKERIVYPASVRSSHNPLTHLAAFTRARVRDALRTLPGGWKAFQRIEGAYPAAANNAVLGSAPRGRVITRLVDDLLEMPDERQDRLYAIGPHLLQAVCDEFSTPGLVVHPPSVFYPLGPEISEHWFRTANVRPNLELVLRPETRVVHWYASGRTRKLIPTVDPTYVRSNANRQLFSALALPFV